MPNRVRARLVWLFLCAGGYAWLPGPARAQGLQISPIMVEFLPGQMTTTLLVNNKSPLAASLQLRPFQWTQVGGVDTLTPTAELAVSPPITGIGGGEAQTFRIVLRHEATTREASYRLLLDQLPPPGSAGTVRVVLRLSIPVFADPDRRLERSLTWRIVLDQHGASLVAVNGGGGHVRILNPVLTLAGGGRAVVTTGQGPYILPDSTRSWPIRATSPLRSGSTLHLVATSDGGPIDAMVQVSGP